MKLTSLLSVAILGIGAMVMGLTSPAARAADQPQWNVFKGTAGPGVGKKIVLVSGDEEYRSEEGLTQLGKILAQRQGFTCTVLYAIDPKTGEISPNYPKNIPGLEALDDADLLIIQTRFRDLPDAQMKHVDEFLMAGKPVIGLRTATHAFNAKSSPTYQHYSWHYKHGTNDPWADGFGRVVLGETWVAHHGSHKNESTRGRIAPGAASNPILHGIKDGEIWTCTDVYAARLPMQPTVTPLILGEVTKRPGPIQKNDPFYGMRPTDHEPDAAKNNPMMPVAWTKNYQLPGGKPGHSFCTTTGAAIDLTNEALRRLLVNAALELTGLPVPDKADVQTVGDYKPHAYGFNGYTKGLKPADLR